MQRIQYYSFPIALHMQIKYALPMQIWILKFTKFNVAGQWGFIYDPKYHKIPKISPGAYIFQGPFLRGLFLEGLIFGGAYIRRGLSTEGNLHFKIDWASLIVGSKSTVFALF